MKEREISLIDLFVEILLHWRSILVLMLAGGICLGGFSYIRSDRNAKMQKLQLQQEQQELEQAEDVGELFSKRLKETEISDINTAIVYEQMYREKADFYGNDSILAKVDPNKVSKAYLTFFIKAEDLEYAYNIEEVYEHIVCGSGLYEYLSSRHGMDTAAVSELVSLANPTAKKDTGANSFRLTVVHYDTEQCDALAQSIVDYVKEQEIKLQQELGEHELIVLDQSIAVVADTNIASRQKTYIGDIISYMSSVAKFKDAFTETQRQYYEYLIAQMADAEAGESAEYGEAGDMVSSGEDGKEQEAAVMISPSVSIKYVILGMALAAFLYVFIIFLRYVMNNKIRYTDDIQELYGLPQLGQIPRQRDRRAFGFVDEWFCALRERDKRKFTAQEAVNLAAVAVKMAVKKGELKSVALIGCGMEESGMSVCRQIEALLEKEGVGVDVLNNVLYDAETMEKLGSAQGVVLVEKAGSTLYEEIAKELDLVQRQSIAVLGGIVQE